MLVISEEEKKNILSKYEGNTSNNLLDHLKRTYPATEVNFEWMKNPYKQIYIEDKLYPVHSNKKRLVNILSNILEDGWSHIDTNELRRTVKKYIDGIGF